MTQKLQNEVSEVIRLIAIEGRLGKTTITKEDAHFVKELADKKRYPRAEYVFARMYLCGHQIEKYKAMGMKYLAKSSRHANYLIQLKIAYIYNMFSEFKKIRDCLERALEDVNYLYSE